MKLNLDCRYFIGEKPCIHNRLCDGCEHYTPFGKKILIIKLGAMGDVIRTTPLLRAIEARHNPCHVTWIVEKGSAIFLENNPRIHRVLEYSLETAMRIQIEQFDSVYSLDKTIAATSLATLAQAPQKFGFGFSPVGNIYPLTPEAEYSFSLGMSDQIKFVENEKTYQRDIFDAAGFGNVAYGEYDLPMCNFNLAAGAERFGSLDSIRGKKVVGLNTGAGEVFKTKRYWKDHFISLIHKLAERGDIAILLLGGPSEVERNRYIRSTCTDVPNLIDTGCDNSLADFMGILNLCDVVVTGDTLALHLAVALKKRVIALFGSTCAQEIDLYGRGEKIVSLPECAPCYKKDCPWKDDRYMICMKAITPERIYESVNSQLKQCGK